ncbi:DUF819 family protein [Methylomarinum vadi]|uniref:DUF819 family protein n=1 Tax=Methylomarinum vadi TaxID=438855 RepID=UPI001F38F8EC|nr:DUF819 family protein [Methylomarinum vadi]
MAVLFSIAALGFLAERTRLGAQLTGTVVVILSAIVAANAGLLPHQAPAYDFVFSYFVPVLIPLFLFKADLRRIFFEITRTTMAFLLACVGTVGGVIVAITLLDLTNLANGATIDPSLREPAIAGLFSSTYIGGSVNYAALGEITGLREDASFFAAATATDNLFSALYLVLLAMLPGWRWLANRFQPRDHDNSEREHGPEHSSSPEALAASLALALLIVATADALAEWLHAPDWRYALITVLTLLPATLFPRQMAKLHGGYELAIPLAFVFFAAIAAGADVMAMVEIAPLLVLLVLILLFVHALITFGLGALFGFSLPELITASNAAVLGATTAPALAVAKGWKDLVMPGVLVGVFGYALGTLIGTAVFRFCCWF